VAVRDTETRQNALLGATLIIRGSGYADMVRVPATSPPARLAESIPMGFDREGTYEVRVHKPGYRDWVQQDIQVRRRGRCRDLQTVPLVVYLKPDRSLP
jgi:hypothetical protein